MPYAKNVTVNSLIAYQSILSTRVVKEIAASWEWYEERQVGLGDRFAKEVLND